MDANNGNEVEGSLSPTPLNSERIAILDAGAQYGKVRLILFIYLKFCSMYSNVEFLVR
jgi:hypothetical protein